MHYPCAGTVNKGEVQLSQRSGGDFRAEQGVIFIPVLLIKRKVELCSNCFSQYRKHQKLILYAVYRGVLRQTGVEVERRRARHVWL